MRETMKKKMITWYKRYQNSSDTTLGDVYNSWSDEKQSTFDKIKRRYKNEYQHYELRIIGSNSSYYTTASICYDDNIGYFVVETYASTYTCGYSNGMLFDLFTGEVFYDE